MSATECRGRRRLTTLRPTRSARIIQSAGVDRRNGLAAGRASLWSAVACHRFDRSQKRKQASALQIGQRRSDRPTSAARGRRKSVALCGTESVTASAGSRRPSQPVASTRQPAHNEPTQPILVMTFTRIRALLCRGRDVPRRPAGSPLVVPTVDFGHGCEVSSTSYCHLELVSGGSQSYVKARHDRSRWAQQAVRVVPGRSGRDVLDSARARSWPSSGPMVRARRRRCGS